MLYEKYIREKISEGKVDIEELRGKNIGCWCSPGNPCHGHILVKILNEVTGNHFDYTIFSHSKKKVVKKIKKCIKLMQEKFEIIEKFFSILCKRKKNSNE